MLSILIPIYNFDCRVLIKELSAQIQAAGIVAEILCIDDNSNEKIRALHENIKDIEYVVYHKLEQNVGRSKIRNMLAVKAKYEYLLFMDCDSEIINENYIKNYLRHLNPNEVIYGGRSYRIDPPRDRKYYLRWHYGVQREYKSSENRNGMPYRCFMTNNFLIHKSIYHQIQSYEKIEGYGHEDTLFAIDLKKKNISIRHIDNFLNHIGLEKSQEFISKTENGVKNLAFLIIENRIDNQIKLYRAYKFVKRMHLQFFVKIGFGIFEKLMIRNLNSTHPSLTLFDFYKLGLLTRFLS